MNHIESSIAATDCQSSRSTTSLKLKAKRLALRAASGLVGHWYFWLLGAVLIALYAPILKDLILDWAQDPDYGHGFLVPVFSGYVVWRTRARWRSLRWQPSNFGLAVISLGIILLVAGSLGAELFLCRMSLPVILGGIVLYLFGWKMLRVFAFPLAYLVLMIPLPTIVYNELTLPLQLLASRLAARSLEVVGVPVLREGNVLILPNYTLEVVAACSGIRSLMSLFALAIAYGSLAERRVGTRVVLALLMIPIAVVSNAFRVFGTGVSTYFAGPQWSEGFFHAFSGWLIFMSALACMLLAHRFLNHVVSLFSKVRNG